MLLAIGNDTAMPTTADASTAQNTQVVPAGDAAGASIPHTAVDTAPPNPLKNIAVDVALPASRASAPVCADRLETGIPTPTPRPSAAASNVTRGAVRLCALTMNAAAAVKITNEDVTASARSLPFFLNRHPTHYFQA